MHKREPRLHLEFTSELPAERHRTEPDHLNAHFEERSHRPDIRQDRKRVRRSLHLLEGGAFDPDYARDLDEAA